MKTTDNFETQHFEFINYVNMTVEQSKEIWRARNDFEVRKWMVNPEPFSYESHNSFVQSLRTKEDRSYWCVLYKFNVINNVPIVYNSVGSMIASFNLNPIVEQLGVRTGEMGKFIFPEFMGKGLGKLCTKEFTQYVLRNKLVNEIMIKTLIDNKKNQHVNASVGFKIMHQDDKYVYMSLKEFDLID